MKWLFYVIVFVYMLYRAAYGLNTVGHVIIVDDNTDLGDGIFIEAGQQKSISCKSAAKNQEITWYNPKGLAVPRLQSRRVYASQYFVQSRAPALLLNITAAEVHDSGLWVCRAGDSVRNVSICVIDPTDFEGTSIEAVADEGRSYTLSCKTRGAPEATISWARNGHVIREFEYQDMPKYRVMTKYNQQGIEGLLTIMSLTVEDSGVYTCVATQETELAEKCGKNRTFDIRLHINHAPVFEKTKETLYGAESEILFLTCEASAYPYPTYMWFVKTEGGKAVQIADKEIIVPDNSSGSILSVKVTEDIFESQFICRATNPIGEAEKVFDVLESAFPKKPYQVQMLSEASSSKMIILNVTWNEDIRFDIGKIEIQYIPAAQIARKRATIPKERDWKHSRTYLSSPTDVMETSVLSNLVNLEPSTEYWVRLRIRNDVGESPWSNLVKVSTTEEDENDEDENEKQTKEDRDVDDATESDEDDAEDDSLVTTEKQETPPVEDSGKFYGLFFAVGVLIVAVGCTFVVRMV